MGKLEIISMSYDYPSAISSYIGDHLGDFFCFCIEKIRWHLGANYDQTIYSLSHGSHWTEGVHSGYFYQ